MIIVILRERIDYFFNFWEINFLIERFVLARVLIVILTLSDDLFCILGTKWIFQRDTSRVHDRCSSCMITVHLYFYTYKLLSKSTDQWNRNNYVLRKCSHEVSRQRSIDLKWLQQSAIRIFYIYESNQFQFKRTCWGRENSYTECTCVRITNYYEDKNNLWQKKKKWISTSQKLAANVISFFFNEYFKNPLLTYEGFPCVGMTAA